MLSQEMDYIQEAEQTELYRKRLAGDSRFVVPRIYPEFSNDRIIASSYEAGLRPDDPQVLSLSEERRNRLAMNFLDLYFKELFEWGVVQTDPHLGNYQIRLDSKDQDQLVLFDFGAVRAYEKSFLVPYRKMISASLEKDLGALSKAALQLGFLQQGDDPRLKKIFEEFCVMTVEPFGDEEYSWKDSDLPQRLTKKVFQMMQSFQLRTPPREIIFLDRKTGGVFIFLSVLNARINSRALIQKYLHGL